MPGVPARVTVAWRRSRERRRAVCRRETLRFMVSVLCTSAAATRRYVAARAAPGSRLPAPDSRLPAAAAARYAAAADTDGPLMERRDAPLCR